MTISATLQGEGMALETIRARASMGGRGDQRRHAWCMGEGLYGASMMRADQSSGMVPGLC